MKKKIKRMTRGSKNIKSKTKQSKKYIKVSLEKVSVTLFVIAVGFYLGSRIFVYSYNVKLSQEDQQLSYRVSETRQDIQKLEAEITEMQSKQKVLAAHQELGDKKENIFFISTETVK